MKLNKHSMLIALAILMLIIGTVKAETPVRIGQTVQPNPFEANPAAHTLFGNFISASTASDITNGALTGSVLSVTTQTNARDKDLTTYSGISISAGINQNGKFNVKGFEQDASAPAITQVDLRVRYSYTAGSPAANFQYNITADLNVAATYTTVVGNSGTSAALATYKFDALARPGGGAWTWASIAALRIRFALKRLATTAPNTAPVYRVYEVWLRVQCDGVPKEPSATFPLANAYDGYVDMAGYYGGFREAAGYVKFDTFTTPGFDPTWVDFKAKYAFTQAPDTPSTADEYRLTYWVGGTGETVLQDWTSDASSVSTAGSATVMGRTWFNQPDTYSGGAWTGADVGMVEVRFEVRIVGDEDMVRFDIFEIWLTCYSSPLPPTASPTMAIIPQVIAPGVTSDRFFVDIYVRDMPQGETSGLAGWQFDLNYDSNEVTAVGPLCVYWPWLDEAAYDLSTVGVVKISYTIPTSIPIYTIGAPGSDFPIARVYFEVVATSTNYSPLWFTVSFLGAPDASKVAHSVWHGLYGNIPVDSLGNPIQYIVGCVPPYTRPPLPPLQMFPYETPISTLWTEEFPHPGNRWHLSSWEDNGVPPFILDVSDQIDMTGVDPPAPETWFHVDKIWECDTAVNTQIFMLLLDKTEVPEFPLGLGIMMMIAPAIAVAYIWRTRSRKTMKGE